MKTVEATYKIITPMFLGGANQSPDDGIRPPSIKGALRFWWRALNWGRFRTVTGANDASALKDLHKEEARIFGSAAEGKDGGGQGCFLLRVRHGNLNTTKKDTVHPNFKPTNLKTKNGKQVIDETHLAASRYLAYGLMTAFTSKDKETDKIKSSAGQLERGCIDDNQRFTVAMIFRDKIDDSVLDALKALGLLGGLGSRSRHGMGSIILEKIVDVDEKKEWIAPTTQDNYKEEVKTLLGSLASVPEPDYSAFSKESRVDILLSAKTPYDVLDEFGTAMLMYRSWGKYEKVIGMPSEKRFVDDHNWLRDTSFIKNNPKFHPRRVMFGLPHNYGKRDDQKVNAVTHERRSSPLLFHVHRLSDTAYIGVSVLLRSLFLPAGEEIKAGNNKVPANVADWGVITDFLDGRVGDTPTNLKPEAPLRFPVPPKKAVFP